MLQLLLKTATGMAWTARSMLPYRLLLVATMN